MSLSRRDFFRFGAFETVEAVARAANAVGSALAPHERPGTASAGAVPAQGEGPARLRPPGALDEPEFRAACTRCDACIAACPKQAIKRAGAELGGDVAGTPVILPAEQPCWLCPDMPCIPVCEPGALLPLASPDDARMGTVEIREDACYAARGNICEACAERCPTRPKAVTIAFGSGPVLFAERCTGCGICAWLCPAQAIDVLPPR